MEGNFKRHNTLNSQNTPNFQHRPISKTAYSASTHKEFATTPSTNESKLKSLSDLGDSNSLFSYKTPADFEFGRKSTPYSGGQSPIPFVFGTSDPPADLEVKKEPSFVFGTPEEQKPASFVFDAPIDKMVREVSPAKPAARPTSSHMAFKMPDFGTPDSADAPPKFGIPSMPQSPLNRPPPQREANIRPVSHNVGPPRKEDNIFYQPKKRPEHHRAEIKPAHPHLQAFADKARKVMEPILHSGNKYAPPPGAPVPLRAPVAPSSSFVPGKPAQQTFSSLDNDAGLFQPVNPGYAGHNYVDLTMNSYRDRVPEIYTFVDPAKAQEDLKALLEGVIEDEEDDVPKTRSRKKKQEADKDGLVAKLEALSVGGEKIAVTSDDEDEDEDEDEDDGTVEGVKVKLLPHQIEGLEWMKGRELGTGGKGKVPKGGILADDMGLGKTLQSISLILNNPRPDADDAAYAKRKLPTGIEKTTLVVAPLALIRQWELEIKDKVERSHALRVCVHHGPQRTKRFQDLKRYDVVITTYQILVSEFGNSSTDENGLKVGCFGLHWYRVILDEAHTIKNRNAKATQACYNLRCEYRWCLTGTPMQNNLDELQSLVKFLRIKPYDDLREWKDQIDRPLKNGRGDVAIKRLRAFLKIFMKRRTKDILKKDGALNPGGKPSAPGAANTTGFKVTERRIEKVFAEFSPEEREFYDRLETRTDASIEQMMEGKVNYASALVLLLRLRQACNHPKLVEGKLAKDGEALAAENTNTKTQSSSADVDEMADMFGSLGVGAKKCEVCQIELGKTAISEGAIRCLDCVADLAKVSKKSKSSKDKKHKKHREKHSKSTPPQRKPRNRAVILDSDDEEEQGEWVVKKKDQGSLTLGKAGGIDDENADGGGDWLVDSEDETFPDLDNMHKAKKVIDTSDSEEDSESGSASDSESDVEDEFGSSDEEARLATIISSTKITHLLKILGEEAAQHKFIVFSQFTSMLDLIEPFLRQKGFKFTRYDGSMKNDDREASLGRLRNDANCRVLLCSLKCGSLGLNLTAATRVVILEPFWNPFVEEQAIDRVHRLTQKIDVIVYKITIKNSVEERILDLQEKKRELAKQTIEAGGKGGAGKLGMKEILSLFRREAEHAPPAPSVAQFNHSKPRILKEVSTSSQGSSRETFTVRERQVSPPMASMVPKKPESEIFGRRW